MPVFATPGLVDLSDAVAQYKLLNGDATSKHYERVRAVLLPNNVDNMVSDGDFMYGIVKNTAANTGNWRLSMTPAIAQNFLGHIPDGGNVCVQHKRVIMTLDVICARRYEHPGFSATALATRSYLYMVQDKPRHPKNPTDVMVRLSGCTYSHAIQQALTEADMVKVAHYLNFLWPIALIAPTAHLQLGTIARIGSASCEYVNAVRDA